MIPAGSTILKVELGLESYVSGPATEKIRYQIGWDGGDVAWGTSFDDNHASETLTWRDVTAQTDWTTTKLDNNHLSMRIQYLYEGGGCYGLDSEVGLWNGTLIKARYVKVGDVLTGWNGTEVEGYWGSEKLSSDFVPTKVLNVTLHEGNWDLIRIISGNIQNMSNRKDVLVTLEHALPYIAELESEGEKFKVKIGEKQAQHFEIGDRILGFIEPKSDESAHFQVYQVSEIQHLQTSEGVIDIQTETKWMMGHYLLAKKQPDTGYADWVPIRVTYTEEVIDCNWIGMNNTVAGDPTEFKADFTDLNASDGLSHFRCLHNNTGTFENTTWSDAWSGNWSIIELTLNSTGDLTIAFRFIVNDTGGTEHESTWCFFPTHSPASDDGWGAGGYDYDPTGNFWVDGWMINIQLPTWDLWVHHNLNVKGIFWTIILAVCVVGVVQQVFKHPKKEIVKVFQE